jgi:hypothetical protein
LRCACFFLSFFLLLLQFDFHHLHLHRRSLWRCLASGKKKHAGNIVVGLSMTKTVIEFVLDVESRCMIYLPAAACLRTRTTRAGRTYQSFFLVSVLKTFSSFAASAFSLLSCASCCNRRLLQSVLSAHSPWRMRI